MRSRRVSREAVGARGENRPRATLPTHHRFSQQEVLDAINRGKKRAREMLLTTQKDAVRFPKIDRRPAIYFMRVEIKIIAGRRASTMPSGESASNEMNLLLHWIGRAVIAWVQLFPLTWVARRSFHQGRWVWRVDRRHRRVAISI